MLSAMGALLVVSLAVPEAFGEDALIFGCAYAGDRGVTPDARLLRFPSAAQRVAGSSSRLRRVLAVRVVAFGRAIVWVQRSRLWAIAAISVQAALA